MHFIITKVTPLGFLREKEIQNGPLMNSCRSCCTPGLAQPDILMGWTTTPGIIYFFNGTTWRRAGGRGEGGRRTHKPNPLHTENLEILLPSKRKAKKSSTWRDPASSRNMLLPPGQRSDGAKRRWWGHGRWGQRLFGHCRYPPECTGYSRCVRYGSYI